MSSKHLTFEVKYRYYYYYRQIKIGFVQKLLEILY